jgi:hypothetical protein
MNQLIEPPHVRRMPNLMLHCGAHTVDMEDVAVVVTPRATHTWTPIPHAQLIQTVQRALGAAGLCIGTQTHSLSHEGQRYFGLMEINGARSNDDYCWVLGLRNSHDKTFPAGIVAGASVFVCDNLSFSGEVKFARKHPRYIVRDLPLLTGGSQPTRMPNLTTSPLMISSSGPPPTSVCAATASSRQFWASGGNLGMTPFNRAMPGACSTPLRNPSRRGTCPNYPSAPRRCTG